MAALSGHILPSCESPPRNENITAEFEQYALPWWPPTAAQASVQLNGSITKNYPVSARALEKSGYRVPTFFDDFYNRIHINPKSIDLGNIVTNQQVVVQIWNAYLVPRTLNAVTGETDGVAVTGPVTPPAAWPALQELSWDLEIDENGNSELDLALAWLFDSETVELPITGTRIVAWPFFHSVDAAIIEVLAWATDIMRSRTGMEQRRALRQFPRRSFDKQYLAEDREHQLLQSLMAGWGSRNFALQMEQDIQLLAAPLSIGALRINCITEYRDFQIDSMVMLYRDAFNIEVAVIEAIDSTGLDLARPLQKAWPVGTRIYPARSARMQAQPAIKRLSNTSAQWGVSWLVMESSSWTVEAPATTYRGFPVFDLRPDESRELTHTMHRLLLQLDTGTGIPKFLDTADLAFEVRDHVHLSDKVGHAALRKILYYMAGRFKSMWVPTWADDLTIATTIGSSATEIVIEHIGYTRYCFDRPGRQDIRIELHSGTVYFRRITAAVETSVDVETLTLNSALGETVAPEQISRVSYLILCRGESDSVRIEHETDDAVRTGLLFSGVRDDV